MSTYLTVAIPYVNSVPHLGYAYELIEADLVARARRALGEPVRFLGGTDDFSLKNVLAAEAAGEPTQAYVDRHADRFAALAEPLGITFDDFIRTSTDARHAPAVERLWRACAAADDLYRREYAGRYCVGCEQFYEDDELDDGTCPEHGTPVEPIAETNWFFRLSRYAGELCDRIERDELVVEPLPFRNEVLAFVRGGLRDISVSRSARRARGWGVPVPGDPTQVVYVWFDALVNYVSALGYGTDDPAYDAWWRRARERIHVVGKGILRFHAVFWPAFLLSAGEPLPDRIHVHPYLTVDGAKLSKSSGGGAEPTVVVRDHGADALRWWIARDVSPTSDTDFTVERLAAVADDDLANGLGNAVGRVTTVAERNHVTGGLGGSPLARTVGLTATVADALAGFDRRLATDLVRAALAELNQDIDRTAPWKLARDPASRPRLEAVVATHLATLREIAGAIAPITPELAARIADRLATPGAATTPVFPRLAGRG